MTEHVVSIRLDADGKGLIGELRSSTGEVRRFASEAGQAGEGASRSFARTRESVASVGDQLRRARADAIAFFSIRGAVEVARGLISIADGYASIQGKLRNVAADQAQLASVNDRVFATAQKTYTALDSTAALAVKNTRVFLGMGTSHELAQQKGLRLAETIQKAIAVSGSTSAEANSLVLQLGQSLQSGVLQGDEFRSVMENGGRVIQALTDYTGKSVAELRKMAEQGKLTSQIVLDAMSAAASKIDQEFGRNVPLTVGRAWTVLQNAVTQYIGEADQSLGVTRSIGSGMVALSKNLDLVANSLTAVALAGAASLGGRLVGYMMDAAAAMRAKAAAAINARAAMSAELEMTALVTAGIGRQTVARTVDLQATLQTITAARQEVVAKQAVANVLTAEAERQLVAARAAGALSFALRAVRDAEVQLAAAQQARAAISNELAALGRAQAAVQAQLAAATNVQIAAQLRAAEAEAAATVTTSRLAVAKGLLATAGSGLLTLLGGWPTVLLAAGAALVYFATRATETSTELDRLEAATESLRKSGFSLGEVFVALSTGQQLQKRSLLETMQAQLSSNDAEMRALEIADAHGQATQAQRDRYLQLGEQTQILRGDVAKLTDAQVALNVELLKTAAVDKVTNAYNLMSGAIAAAIGWREQLASSIRSSTKDLDEQAEKYAKATRELGKTQTQIQEINKSIAIADKAKAVNAKEGSEAYKIIVAEMDRAYAKVIAEAQANDQATAARKAHTQALREDKTEITQTESATDRLAGAQGKLADMTAKARGELSPLAKVASDHERSLRDIAKAGGEAIKAIRDHAKATKDFSDVATKEKQIQDVVRVAIEAVSEARDKDTAAARKQVDVLGEYLRQLDEDRATLGMSERQLRINEALREQTRLFTQNVGPIADNRAAYAELTSTVVASEGAFYDQSRAVDSARESASRYASIVRGAFDSMIDATAKWAVSGFKDAKAFWRGMVDQVKNAVAAMLAEWAKTKVIGWLAGTNTGGMNWAGMFATAMGGSGGGGGGFNVGNSISQIGVDYATGGAGSGGLSNQVLGSSVGQYAPWLGAIAGAYMGSQRGDGGVGTVGSTIAYAGLGYSMGSLALSAAASVGAAAAATTAAAAATAGAAATTAGSAAAAAAAGSAAASGTAAAGAAAGGSAISGAAVAIPIIGWVLAIIAAIDYASGGKVFGTQYRPQQSTVSLGLGPEGATADASLVEWKYRRNILQFNRGGSLEAMRRFGEVNRRERDIEATPEMIKAAQRLFNSIQQVMADSANRIAIETPPMIDAALNTVVEYDKKGKIKATKYFVEVLGRSFEEATAELAVIRLAAEAQLAVVSAATGGEASRLAEKYRDDAKDLAAAAEFLVTAQADIARGNSLLGQGASLTRVTGIVEELARSGETLSTTYGRLISATTNVRDAFGLAGTQLNRLGEDLVRFANQIYTQAGGEEQGKQLWQRFFSTFYSETELNQFQADQLKPQLSSGLTNLGLDTDTTMAEFREEFERRLPTLTAAQVVEWLRLGDVLATVTDLVDRVRHSTEQAARAIEEEEKKRQSARQSYAELVVNMGTELAELGGSGMSNFQKALVSIGVNMQNNIRTLNELARAAGLAGAREEDLTRAHQLAAAQATQAAKQLELASKEIAKQLWGNAEADKVAQTGYALHSVADGIDAIRTAAEAFREAMLLDDQLSPLNTQQQLDEAIRQLRETGSADTGRRTLEIGRELMASGADYRALFDLVSSLIRPQVEAGQGAEFGGTTIENELSPAERLTLAQQLAQNVADLSGFGGRSFADVAEMLGFSLQQLGSDLGLQGQALDDYLQSLQLDDYGLDELSTVISRQVDRIIQALGGPRPLNLGPDPDRTKPVTRGGINGDGPGRPLAPGFGNGAAGATAGGRGNGPTTGGPVVGDGPGRPRVLTGNKSAEVPYVERGNATPLGASEASADALIASMESMAQRLETALQEIARITASTGEANEDAIKRVEGATRDSARETRLLAESVNLGGGIRQREYLR